jgi:hypothetical protein
VSERDELLDAVNRLTSELAAAQRELDAVATEEWDKLKEELAAARTALQPFADTAHGIPDNWPEECHLRIDNEPVVMGDFTGCREWLCYHGVNDCQDACLPTIKEWREAARAAGGAG